jgi:hypothetical protein
VFVDPAFRNFLQRSGIEVMAFFAAMPKGNGKFGAFQDIEMFTDSLPGHLKVAAEFVQGLAIVLVELVEQRAASGMSEGTKDGVHWANMQPNSCMSSSQTPAPLRSN